MKNKFLKRILRQEKYRAQEGKVGPNGSKIKNTYRAGSGIKKDCIIKLREELMEDKIINSTLKNHWSASAYLGI